MAALKSSTSYADCSHQPAHHSSPGQMLDTTASSNIALTGYQGRRANPMTGTHAEIAAQIRPFQDLGLKHWVAGLDPTTPKAIEEFGSVMEILDKG